MIQWDKLFSFVENLLKQQLQPQLTYHNWEHTLYVMKVCENLCDRENVSSHERLLVQTAALFHDAGFINTSKGHEAQSILLAQKELPHFGFTPSDIDMVSGMIRATIIPQDPKTALENIVADADLYYLGTDEFHKTGFRLYTEWKYFNPSLSISEWNKIQIKFLQSHHYHTDYCIRTLTEKKEMHLSALMQNT